MDGLLSLSHVRNRGAAFGILSDWDLPYQTVLLAALSLGALLAIAVYFARLPAAARLPRLALALVLGGAVGNLIDRLRLGYVVDFVHVYWRQLPVARLQRRRLGHHRRRDAARARHPALAGPVARRRQARDRRGRAHGREDRLTCIPAC